MLILLLLTPNFTKATTNTTSVAPTITSARAYGIKSKGIPRKGYKVGTFKESLCCFQTKSKGTICVLAANNTS